MKARMRPSAHHHPASVARKSDGLIFKVLQGGASQLLLFFFLDFSFAPQQAAGMLLRHETRQIKGNFMKRGGVSNVAANARRLSEWEKKEPVG